MNRWSESNFLETLMPLLQKESEARKNSCPDVETLCAVVDGTAGAFIRESVTGHLEHCNSCVRMRESILLFGKQESLERGPDWAQTEKRLDNWMDGYLRAQATAVRRKQTESSPERSDGANAGINPFRWAKLGWAAGLATAVVLVAGSVFLFERIENKPPVVQTASNAIVPAPPQIAPPASEPATPIESKNPAATAGKKTPSSSAVTTAPTHAPTTENPSVAPVPVIPGNAPPVESAKADVPPSPVSDSNSPIVAPQPVPNKGSAPLRSTARGNTYGADFDSGARGNSAPSPVTVRPASIRLDAGTTLMILMSVVSPKKDDGSFVFRGTLVEPISQPGARLGKGAEVRGYTTVTGGKTSVHVLEFVVSGTLYKLNGDSSTASTRPPGTGGALQLEKGQVLETWLATVSVYDRAADKPSQSPPPK